MKVPPIAYFETLINRYNGLKYGDCKNGSCAQQLFQFFKTCYYLAPQIHGYYYYNNLQIGRAIGAKDLINLL